MSPQRVDYYDSPDAPKASSLVPAVNVVVANDAGEILLIRRADNGNWALPAGAIDLGESVAQAAVRETLEESGIQCAITGIVGIYSDPKHVILYTSNGEARQEFSILLTGRPLSGQPTPSSESSDVRWVPPTELPAPQASGRFHLAERPLFMTASSKVQRQLFRLVLIVTGVDVADTLGGLATLPRTGVCYGRANRVKRRGVRG